MPRAGRDKMEVEVEVEVEIEVEVEVERKDCSERRVPKAEE